MGADLFSGRLEFCFPLTAGIYYMFTGDTEFLLPSGTGFDSFNTICHGHKGCFKFCLYLLHLHI